MNSITVNVSLKTTVRYRVVKALLCVGLALTPLSVERAVSIMEKWFESGGVYKFRVGKGKWRLLRGD